MSRSPTTASLHNHNIPEAGNSQELFEEKVELRRRLEAARAAESILKSKQYIRTYISRRTGEERIRWRKSLSETECKYGCGVPIDLLNPAPKRKKREDPKKVFEYDNPGLLDKIRQKTYSDAELLKYYKRHCAKTPIIGYENGDGNISIYKLPARGSKYYSDTAKLKINKYENRIKEIDDEMFFITLTFNRKVVGNDNVRSWKIMKEVLPDFLRELNRDPDGAYICVKEAQEDGTCHAHILYANPNIPKKKFKWKKKWRTNNKEFRRRIQELWGKYGFRDIIVVPGEKAVGYMAKYISKGIETEAKMWEAMDDDQKEAQRKGLLGLALSQCAGSRLFHVSRNLSKREKQKDVKDEKTYPESLIEAIEKQQSENSKAIDLITLFNNSQCPHYKRVMIIVKKHDKQLLEPWVGTLVAEDSKVWRVMQKIGRNCGCPGCILTNIAELYREQAGYYDAMERYKTAMERLLNIEDDIDVANMAEEALDFL